MVLTRPLAVLAFALLYVSAHAASLDRQRDDFLAAERAIARGDLATFGRLEKTLRGYALHPYLEYAALSRRLDATDRSAVEDFLARHDGSPLADRLRFKWIDHLAAYQRWAELLAVYRPGGGVKRECQHLQALLMSGQREQALAGVADIWLHGRSQPSACDPVFAAWTAAGKRTDDMVWQRIELAMAAGQTRLADYLGRSLSDGDRSWVAKWIALYRNPSQLADRQRFADPHPYRETMLAQAMRRQARLDGLHALRIWQQIKPIYDFSPDQVNRTEQYLIRNLARVAEAEAYEFVRGVSMTGSDEAVRDSRIRSALLREDWPQVIEWIGELPEAERNEDRWLYWLARGLEGSGDHATAERTYARAALHRSYYGFLAADRIGAEYHLEHVETPVDPAVLAEVAKLDGVARARELFELERLPDARREWIYATRDLDRDRLKAAAKLAEGQGWHDRAIFTLAKTDYWDDLELRFPLEHADLVAQNAARQGIDKAWIFAVMRQESAFMQNARSHAGAVGLMQLMPATARKVARDVLKRRAPKSAELYEPDVNIALGSAYLKQMKEELGDSAVLATAAYNAGPHRVTAWLPPRKLPADVWIELVPFNETRGYLRRVLAYTVIYEKRMGHKPVRLAQRLHPVPPDLRLLEPSTASRDAGSAG